MYVRKPIISLSLSNIRHGYVEFATNEETPLSIYSAIQFRNYLIEDKLSTINYALYCLHSAIQTLFVYVNNK